MLAKSTLDRATAQTRLTAAMKDRDIWTLMFRWTCTGIDGLCSMKLTCGEGLGFAPDRKGSVPPGQQTGEGDVDRRLISSPVQLLHPHES